MRLFSHFLMGEINDKMKEVWRRREGGGGDAIYALALIRQTLSQSNRPTTSPPTFSFAEHTCQGVL